MQSWCVLFASQKTSKKTHISYQRSSVIHHLKGKHLATPVLGYPFHRNCLQLECNYWTENGEGEQGHSMELMIYNFEKETKAKQPANLQYTSIYVSLWLWTNNEPSTQRQTCMSKQKRIGLRGRLVTSSYQPRQLKQIQASNRVEGVLWSSHQATSCLAAIVPPSKNQPPGSVIEGSWIWNEQNERWEWDFWGCKSSTNIWKHLSGFAHGHEKYLRLPTCIVLNTNCWGSHGGLIDVGFGVIWS